MRPKLLYIIYTVFSTNLLYTGYKMLVLWLKHPDEMHRKHYTCRISSVRIFSKSNGTGRANKASKVGEWERKYCLSLSLQWNRAVEKHKPRERTISMHREQKRAKRGNKLDEEARVCNAIYLYGKMIFLNEKHHNHVSRIDIHSHCSDGVLALDAYCRCL